MVNSLVSLQQRIVKISKKSMKIVYIKEENIHHLNDLRTFNEIFRKDMAYDNIKSHKKRIIKEYIKKINKKKVNTNVVQK